ncbi:MAG: hypothetical protein HWD61_04135 [Parachlamydiaceae bacterium]|nr:MAG: hypothetical protein HWD61_04135 [Parachlamydiaceae bacterium]
MNILDKSEILSDLSIQYINFINSIGCGENTEGKNACCLFADACKKNFNGRWVAQNRDSFVHDLLSVYENHGSWKIIPIDKMIISDNNSVVLWIHIEAKNFGRNTAIVILRYDSDNLIKEIIEVFSPIQNEYEFELKKQSRLQLKLEW